MNRNTLSNGIIFGSTGTLGSRISLDLAQMNTNLILHGKSFEKLIKLDNEIRKINKNVTLLQADITHMDFAANLLSKVASRFSRIDFMINLVGVFFGLRPLTNFSHKEWDNLIEVNLSSYWRIIKELEPLIRKSANAKIIFLENKDISNIAVIKDICNELKINFNEIEQLASTDKIKTIYLSNSEKAIKKDVFGAPTFIFEKELFWGQDSLYFLEKKLKNIR